MDYREKVLKAIRDFEKQFSPIEQFEIVDAIGVLYEIIRAIPEDMPKDKNTYLKKTIIQIRNSGRA